MSPVPDSPLFAVPADIHDFNPSAVLPYGCTVEHIWKAMSDFIQFLSIINERLDSTDMAALEQTLMPANFSSVVSEFMCTNIPKHCPTLARNLFHNGHPDLLPRGRYPNDTVQYAEEGIEVKASRYGSGWQGHNAENCWLMVFTFDAARARDTSFKPFQFLSVVGAQLTIDDWNFSGRSETSRRTITASVNESGCAKMKANCIYRNSHTGLYL